MNSDDRADEEFQRHILGCLQLITFAIAICILAVVYYDQPTRRDQVEKTRYELKAEVEKAFVLPKTLHTEAQQLPISGTVTTLFAVYGTDDKDRRVWCATFVDSDEAMSWVMASKTFGRAVQGAVIADQKPTTEDSEQAKRDAKIAQIRDDLATGKLIKVDHEDGSASLYDGPNADKPN